jgi:hypothetical protein
MERDRCEEERLASLRERAEAQRVGRHILCQSGARDGGSWSRPDNRKIELSPEPESWDRRREQAPVAPPRQTHGLADPIRGAH